MKWLLIITTILGRAHCLLLSKASRRTALYSSEGIGDPEPGTRTRRVRYSGRYPKRFEEKYKELSGDAATIAKVISKGNTPAGQHIPIMLESCLQRMGLSEQDNGAGRDTARLVVDCTLGYGGHSSAILERLLLRNDKSKLLSLDQDPIESQKAEARLRAVIDESGQGQRQNTLRIVNINFRHLLSYLCEHQLQGKVSALLCDLGCSSMQLDDASRGFTFKADGPLDMRMDPVNNNVTAAVLLQSLSGQPQALARILVENSDEIYAEPIAQALVGGGKDNIPTTTSAFRKRIQECLSKVVTPKQDCNKQLIDATTRRSMQALRIEINQEFSALDDLLASLEHILAPGGTAVFLTFHSGEDRRVKKCFKAGFNRGSFAAWSREVERADWAEQRSNPRSSCVKLRWATRASGADSS